jgi:hypothetical protein
VALLSAAEVEALRATAATALDGTAIVQTQSLVSDGGGGGTTAWTAKGTFDCRLAPFRPGEGVEGERISPESQVVFTFPANTEVDHNAQIVYGGGTFAVTGIRQRSVEMTRRVEAKEID